MSSLQNASFGSSVWGPSPQNPQMGMSFSKFTKAGSFRHHLPTSMAPDYFENLEEEMTSSAPNHLKCSSPVYKKTSIVDGCEETQVCQDLMIAMEYLHSREKCLNKPDLFKMNDEMQSMKELPLKEVVRAQFWDQWRECCDRHINHRLKVAVKLRSLMLSKKIEQYPFFVPIGNASILDVRNATLHHIWSDAKAARNFNSLWKRMWEALFEYRVDAIHCPSSVMLAMQGYFVTSTALPPLDEELKPIVPFDREDPKTTDFEDEDGEELQVDEMEMLSYLMRRVRIIVGSKKPFPLYKGVDGRYYIMSIEPLLETLRYIEEDGWDHALRMHTLSRPELVKKKLFDFIASGGPRAQSETHATADGNRPTRNIPTWDYLQQVCIPRATVDLLDTVSKMVDISDGQVRIDDIVNKRIIPIILHAHGCNLCLMYWVYDSPLMRSAVDSDGRELVSERAVVLLKQALEVEMLGRTLKYLCRLDLNIGEGKSIEDRDAYRVAVPNRLASLYISRDTHFWDKCLIPMLRKKFMTPFDFNIDIDVALPGVVLRHMTQRIGCEISADEFRFGGFCWCSSSNAMVLRPPHLMQLFRSKQYAELDTEMDNLWKKVDRVFRSDGINNTSIAVYAQAITATAMARSTANVQTALSFFNDKIKEQYRHDDVIIADVSGWISEFIMCNNPDTSMMLKTHLPTLQRLQESKADAPYIANRMITCGMFTGDLNAVLEGLRVMNVPSHVKAAKYSAIYKFGVSVAETLLSQATANDTVHAFFEFAKKHSQAIDNTRYMLVATSLAVLCDMDSPVLGSTVVAFACDTYATQVRRFGALHPACCLASYHLAYLALACLGSDAKTQPAVSHHLQLMVKALSMVRRVPSNKQVHLAKGRNTQELILRVASVLRNLGEMTPSLLLEYHIESVRGLEHELPLDRICGKDALGDGTEDSPLGTSSPKVGLARKTSLLSPGMKTNAAELRNIDLEEQLDEDEMRPASASMINLRRVGSARERKPVEEPESQGGSTFLNEEVIKRNEPGPATQDIPDEMDLGSLSDDEL